MFCQIDGDPAKSPYENLSDLCTLLVIAEEGLVPPMHHVVHAISGWLQKGKGDGDVVVLGARALALMLDKFPQSLFSSGGRSSTTGTVEKCFETVFSSVKKRRVKLRFTKTTEKELKEELLSCLSLISNCEQASAFAPSTEEQLKFCFRALDDSKWTSCKVLQHCIGLMRRGDLKDAADHEVMVQLIERHLSLLCHLDIDHEWDELLRTVVEGIITYRVWCLVNSSSGKRQCRGSSNSAGRIKSRNRFDGLSSKINSESLLSIGERIFTSGTMESRMQLTMACLASVIETETLCSSSEAKESAIAWIAKLLQQHTTRSTGYSSPFAHTRHSEPKRDELWTNPFQPLPNLQWMVPPLLWSALILLSKLCGADLRFRGEYMWAWRGDGGEYYPYSKVTREKLTAMFFAAERNKKTLQSRHIFDLPAMTDTSALTSVASRIHFQPIPSVVIFDEKISIPPESVYVKKELSVLLQDALRPLSFGHSKTSALARAIRLYVICGGAPTISEDVIAAFRTLAAEQKRSVVGEMSSALMQRNKEWAHVLLEAGVADALSALPSSTATTNANANATTNTNTIKKRRMEKLETTEKEFPVAELIRSAGSSPQVVPIKLPPISDLPAFWAQASSTELLGFIEELEISTLPTKCFENVCSEVSKNYQLAVRLRAATHTYILRILHQTSVAQLERKSLTDRVGQLSHTIGICNSVEGEKNRMKCPNGHPLRVHFSVNWRCDACMKSSALGSLACRKCNYDLCLSCSNAKLSRMDVNASALTGDIIRYWRGCQLKDSLKGNTTPLAKKIKHSILFTSKGILPGGRSSSLLQKEDVHFAEIGSHCQCNIPVPLLADNALLIENISNSSLQIFLRSFGALQQWGDIESAIVDVLESCGSDIFEKGLWGIPLHVSRVLQAMSPYISLQFKRDTSHFLAVGCYRFGLYHLQDANASVRGTVVGDIRSNGLATKFTVKRETKSMTQTLFDAFLQYPTLRNKVEFNFEGEEGTGEGPTQELYAELSQRYREMGALWHEREDGLRELFPTLDHTYHEEFFVLGACCGRAFVDGYSMNVDLLPRLWSLVRSNVVDANTKWELLTELEPTLVSTYKRILQSTDAELKEMDLEDDTGALLTTTTVRSYVESRVEERLMHAVANARWFAFGISTVVDISAFSFLSDDEMSIVLCGAPDENTNERLFDEEALRAAVVEAHGYSSGSREVAMMISVVGGELTREQQGFFLEFLTGSPRLPLNGLAGLGRKITVVRKELEGAGEQTLPSCNTCFLYLKLPPYTSCAIMKKRLLLAITEGRKNFSLS